MGKHTGPKGHSDRKLNKKRDGRKKHVASGANGLPDHVRLLLQSLIFLHAPTVLLKLLYTMFAICGHEVFMEDLDFAEYFAGMEAVTRAMQQGGLSAVGYELKKKRKFMDIMSAEGFLCAVSYILKLKHATGSLLAPVCSSWVPPTCKKNN